MIAAVNGELFDAGVWRLAARRSLGRQFGWLWAAYAVSAYGSGLGFGALPLIAVLVLHASPAQVSALSAVGPAVGTLIALPLGPWVEFHRKRPVMIAMDLARFAVMLTIPIAYALGRLSFVQLLVVSAVVAAAKIAFNAASGAYLRDLVRPDDLLVANARFESTTWSSIAVGPPLGGAAVGLFGPVATVVADALSYLFSALGITAGAAASASTELGVLTVPSLQHEKSLLYISHRDIYSAWKSASRRS